VEIKQKNVGGMQVLICRMIQSLLEGMGKNEDFSKRILCQGLWQTLCRHHHLKSF
jgi:hypothetical protein